MTAWVIKPFDELSPCELYDLLQLRQRVFIVEQRNHFIDCDGYDQRSFHVWGSLGGRIAAACRILPPGVRYVEASLGRVLVVPQCRRRGLGSEVVRHSLAFVSKRWPGAGVRIGAAVEHLSFYGVLGFVATGRPFTEDGILLHDMVLQEHGTEATPKGALDERP